MQSRASGPRRWRVALSVFVVAMGGASALAASRAPAAPVTPAPPATVIATGPAANALVNSASVEFTYTNTTVGVQFHCALDSGAFGDCDATGKTYTDLSDGSHTFKVAATLNDSVFGAQASRTFVMDRTPPTVAITSPSADAVLSTDGWSKLCSNQPGICGTAADAKGIASVKVAVLQDATGKYWDGTDFTGTTETYVTATGTTAWRLPLVGAPLDGTYTLKVRAFDNAGNATDANSAVTRTLTLDSASPNGPTFEDVPDALTSRTTARITFSSSEPTDTFQCKLDGLAYRSCASPFSVVKLRTGQHCLSVRAVDTAGNQGTPAQTCWTIILDTGFTIEGSIATSLSPGVSAPIDLIVTNPFDFAIKVVEITTAMQSGTTKNGVDNAGCNGITNFAITQQLDASTSDIVIPAKTAKSLTDLGIDDSRWPVVQMKALADVDQSACKGSVFRMAFTGTVTTP